MELCAVSWWWDSGELLPEGHVLAGQISSALQEALGRPGAPWATHSTIHGGGQALALPISPPDTAPDVIHEVAERPRKSRRSSLRLPPWHGCIRAQREFWPFLLLYPVGEAILCLLIALWPCHVDGHKATVELQQWLSRAAQH